MKQEAVMRLHVLGCSGPYPERDGATSGYLLEAGDTLLQLDFGSGILGRLTALTAPESLNALLISHWHFDHTSDLLPLIYRLQAAGAVLPLIGPADEASAIRRICGEAGCFALKTVAPGDEFAIADVRIAVGEARHPVPAVGFRVCRQDRAFGYTGDTNTLPSLADFYRGCDLLLADGLFNTETWAEGKPHLSAALAAELALRSGAGRLMLTHFNPTISPRLLLEEARAVFNRTALAEPGAVETL